MPKETPAELATWIEDRAQLLLVTARRLVKETDTRHGQPVGEWLLPLLTDFAAAESIGKRAAHLLSAYALRTGTVTQTEVAKASNLTVTAAGNRAASKIAREVYQEVWPDRR